MKAKYTQAVQSLKRHQAWLARLTSKDADRSEVQECAHDVVVWCLDLLERSPTTRLANWLARKPRRKHLDFPETVVRTEAGRKAAQELIELVVSELNASAAFQSHVDVELLPGVRYQRDVTPAQRLALDRENARRAESGRRRKLPERVVVRSLV